MKRTELKQDIRTGASTVVRNRETSPDSVSEYILGAEIMQAIMRILLSTLPKLVINIFIVLLIDIVLPASAETGFFLMLQRC